MENNLNQNVEQKQKRSTNKKWKIMTCVFGACAVAGLATSIALGVTSSKKQGGGDQSAAHKINIEQPSVAGWSTNLIDAQGNKITDAKIGTEVIYYLSPTESINGKVKVPEYFTINNTEQKYYFSSTDENIYYSVFNVPEANDMNIKTYFAEVDEMVSITFEAGEHGEISGSTSFKIKKESTFGSISKPNVKPEDGYSFAGWYINDVKVEDSRQILGDTVVVAKFQPIVMKTITFQYNNTMGYLYFNSKVINPGVSTQIESGTVWGDVQHPSPIPQTGYEVAGVTVTDAAGEKPLTPDYVFTEDVTITYKFSEIQPTTPIEAANCVGITATANTTLAISKKGQFYANPIIYYAVSSQSTIPSENWNTWDGSSAITINAGDTLYLRSYNFDGFNTKNAYYSFVLTNQDSANEPSIEVKGNLMALLDGGLGTGLKNVPNNYCFSHLFEGSKAIKKATFTNIPTVTTDGCFANMFANCTNLESSNLAPGCTHDYEANCMYLNCAKLKEGFKFNFDTSLGRYACQQMFEGCSEITSSLFTWPRSFSTKTREFGEGCCISMFRRCKKFTTLPSYAFYNGVFGAECFVSMFEESGIQKIPDNFMSPDDKGRDYHFAYGCCCGMFMKCTELTEIADNWLSFRVGHDSYAVLGDICFANIFWGCTKLTKCSLIVNEKVSLAKRCFDGMFINCESLREGTFTLEPTQLAPGCYASMFSGCTSFGKVITLPAKFLSDSCYEYMFNGCRALTQCPELPGIALAPNCYANMFRLTNITTLPKLNNVPLAPNCYNCMFYDCVSITSIPNNYLPATTLAEGCYHSMFYNCRGLTSIPANLLPATTMVTNCYSSMFNSCSKLTNAPSLTNVVVPSGVKSAFESMFNGCKQLKISEGSGRVAFFVGKADDGNKNYRNMFASTGGSYTKDPAEGKTYYYN